MNEVKHDFLPIVKVIEEAYEIPQLGATRKISALLPYDYEYSNKRYPVLYMQDGQNLFNPHAPYGDWAIDRSLARLAAQGFHDIIVIAVDHGEEERIKEYSPYEHNELGIGQGHCYVEFLKTKLIPYVNKEYRVKASPKYTGIGGSSMGGLISLYAGLTEPEVFGKMMIFSPSLWISPMIFEDAAQYMPMPQSKLYLYAGGRESIQHLPNIKKLEMVMRTKPYFEFNLSVDMEGQHQEYYWSREFPEAVKWLYFNN